MIGPNFTLTNGNTIMLHVPRRPRGERGPEYKSNDVPPNLMVRSEAIDETARFMRHVECYYWICARQRRTTPPSLSIRTLSAEKRSKFETQLPTLNIYLTGIIGAHRTVNNLHSATLSHTQSFNVCRGDVRRSMIREMSLDLAVL